MVMYTFFYGGMILFLRDAVTMDLLLDLCCIRYGEAACGIIYFIGLLAERIS